MLHAGRPVCESLVIVQYLNDAFPCAGKAILPGDPYDRAVARFWAAYFDDKFFGAMLRAFKGKTAEDRAAAMTDTLAALDTLEGAFAELSGGKGFFAGDAPGYVDVVLGGFVGWLRAWDKIAGVTLFDAGRIPLLAAWAPRTTPPRRSCPTLMRSPSSRRDCGHSGQQLPRLVQSATELLTHAAVVSGFPLLNNATGTRWRWTNGLGHGHFDLLHVAWVLIHHNKSPSLF